MHGLADSNTSAWTFGSSMMTFAFPMILTILVVAALYVVYTKPDALTGQRKRNQNPGAGK
jgi:hypothetical protein